jgi:predicted PurR-regulated permease PerM
MDKTQPPPTGRRPDAEIIDTAVRLGLLALLAWLAIKVLSPFLALLIWALVLAIAIYPLNQRLAGLIGCSSGKAATGLVLVMVLVLGVPTALLGISFIDHLLGVYQSVQEGSYAVPPPRPEVAGWPLVGPKLFAAWQAASDNMAAFVQEHREQLAQLSRRAAGALGSGLTTLLAFIGAFIIAGIMMAYADPSAATAARIFNRISGPKLGPGLHKLSVATVRSVASGVIGVAFIQAVLLGIGFLLAGIPAAGLLAVTVLLLGIAQLPAALVVLPVIAWLWMAGDASTLATILLTVYLVAAGLADNVLKPLLLGRGLSVPMPIILLGAIGGMLGSGLVGLFAGAVILAIAYEIFMDWVNRVPPREQEATDAD